MTEAICGEGEHSPDTDMGSILDAVWHAALELLESLPGPPQRLRVRAADVTVDLDWRSPAVAIAGQPAQPDRDEWHDRHDQNNRNDQSPELAAAEQRPGTHYVCAPSVGTFYRAPAPGADPFVVEGAIVTAGQQVAIVEAMKLMLPVEADRPGRVAEVLIADGQAVEFGERLLALAPVGLQDSRVQDSSVIEDSGV